MWQHERNGPSQPNAASTVGVSCNKIQVVSQFELSDFLAA
jgi:hypothetical protein